jgi:hypothetical protein
LTALHASEVTDMQNGSIWACRNEMNQHQPVEHDSTCALIGQALRILSNGAALRHSRNRIDSAAAVPN